EIMNKVRTNYAPDETDSEELDQLQAKALSNEAARALLGSIDPFNDYFDEDTLNDFREQLESSYGGIGAFVGMRNGWFTILTPMYNKPAYKAGLHSMDVITKIDGVDITKLRLNGIIKMLKGPPNTEVVVTVQRKGWDKPKEIAVVRDTIDIPSVYTQKLPGNIGYIKMTGFNEGNPREHIKGTDDLLREALVEFNRDNVNGIILDLTNNPGGVLQTAVDVCRKFLDRGKLIVYSKGKPDVYPRRNYFTLDNDPLYDGPLVVMVNSGSASASEIVSGALKDHKRAVLVGTKTYGKGSVQQLIPLRTTHGLTRLKLTIAKYYLPNDECIHKKGIEPNVTVEEPEMTPNESEARWKIREDRDLQNWIEKNFAKYEQKLRELMAFDGFKAENYPEMDSLVKLFQEKYPKLVIDPEMVRKEFRYALRNYLRNNKGEDMPVDIEDNHILQYAIFKLGEMIPNGLPKLPIYEEVSKRVAEEIKVAEAEKEKATELFGKKTDKPEKDGAEEAAAPKKTEDEVKAPEKQENKGNVVPEEKDNDEPLD
ncbi:MAG: PDZ domain-containing protein, partial [Planctomycetes bacterium]|nr:PDZ domain-containing protein [Planctomycetota bacterium]